MRRFRRQLPAPHAHPFVRFVLEEMNRQRCGALDLEQRSGIARRNLDQWRTAHSPTLITIEAALGALGFELAIQPRRDAIDEEPLCCTAAKDSPSA